MKMYRPSVNHTAILSHRILNFHRRFFSILYIMYRVVHIDRWKRFEKLLNIVSCYYFKIWEERAQDLKTICHNVSLTLESFLKSFFFNLELISK